MKTFVGILLILTFGCSSTIIVRSDFDRDVDMKPYYSYAWAENKDIESKNNPLFYNELNDKRIRTVVNSQLKKKGYEMVTENPQLIIHYHIIIEDKTQMRHDPYVLYGPYWINSPTNAYQFSEGTLIIDLMEVPTNNLAWRGWASTILDTSSQITEAIINEAVIKIFKTYPFKAGTPPKE